MNSSGTQFADAKDCLTHEADWSLGSKLSCPAFDQNVIHQHRRGAMLVLARKRNEAIQIGDGIVVKVIQCGRGTVRLGIEAPGHVRVLRAELAETFINEGCAAKSATGAVPC